MKKPALLLLFLLLLPIACSTPSQEQLPDDYFADATPITAPYDRALHRLKDRVVIDKTGQLFQGPMRVTHVFGAGHHHYLRRRGLRVVFVAPGDPSESFHGFMVDFNGFTVGSDGDVFDLLTRVSSPDVSSLEPSRMTKDYKRGLRGEPK